MAEVSAPTLLPLPSPGATTTEALLAAVRLQIEVRGEELIDLPNPVHPPKAEQWLSPTQGGLRYGEVWIAKTPAGTASLVRISSYRVPGGRRADKRPYRRWHGLDVLAFLHDGIRREVRIAKVLKGSRC